MIQDLPLEASFVNGDKSLPRMKKENGSIVDISRDLVNVRKIMRTIGKVFLAFSLGFVALSCEEEDEELKAQLDKQALEIQAKRAELELIRRDVSAVRIKDPTAELAEITVKVEESQALAEEAADEVSELKAEKAKLEEEFADYRRRYPIRN